MPEMMRAAVVHELGRPLVIEAVPIPRPGPHQALVRVDYSGVCHTDLHAARGDWPVRPVLPLIPGHEGSGHVVEVGPDVSGVQVGDLLGNTWLASACGRCADCLSGWETLCSHQRNSGYTVNGSFAEYMLVDTRYAPRIPDEVSPIGVTSILCAGVSAYKALRECGARPGQWVAICGIGQLGQMAIQYAAAMGFRVIAVTGSEPKRASAHSLGAEIAVNHRDGDAGQQVQDLVGGAHAAVVTAASATTVPAAISMARRGGTVTLVGLPPDSFPMSVFETVNRGLTVKGSIVGTREDMREALEFYRRGLVTAQYHTRPLEDVNDTLARMEQGTIDSRIVLDLRA